METGDKVKIYQKPITQEDFEGVATLVSKYLPDEGDGLSIWEVHFENDQSGETYLRTIYESK